MPLPEAGAAWPPKNAKPALELMEIHDAWFSSDPLQLSRVYQSNQSVTITHLDTGEIIATNTIDPTRGYWRNTQREPGRWPGSHQ